MKPFEHASQHGIENPLLRAARLDWPLIVAILLLSGLGLVVLYSASGADLALVKKQAVRLLLGLVLLLAVAQVPADRLALWSPWIYAAGLALLVWVEMAGVVGKGAQRWLDLGVIRFQPSELMKLGVPMMVAWYFSDRPLPPRLRDLAISALMVGVPVALIAAQPDLGTAVLVGAAGLFVIFLAGIGWRLMLGLAAAGLAAAPVLWHFMHDYQRRRVLTLLDPESDPMGAGYHIIQSEIAIGSGGLYGKGWMSGTQSQLDFLPERSTDFIFAVFGEEFGFLGVVGLLVLYGFIILRGLYIAAHAQDTYGRLVAGALSLSFFVYCFVNMCMVSGILPVVGVPLPLISYGGTSMVTLMIAFGMLMSIHSHRRLLAR